jgi:hypothetical protein
MEISRVQKTDKDHARWESEHGHWLKDIEIWYRRHRDAQDLIDSMKRSMQQFSEQVEAHRSHINHHHEVVKMHESALAWNKLHPPNIKDVESESIHRFQNEVHQSEAKVHRQLMELHQKVANDVMKLAYKFGLNV